MALACLPMTSRPRRNPGRARRKGLVRAESRAMGWTRERISGVDAGRAAMLTFSLRASPERPQPRRVRA